MGIQGFGENLIFHSWRSRKDSSETLTYIHRTRRCHVLKGSTFYRYSPKNYKPNMEAKYMVSGSNVKEYTSPCRHRQMHNSQCKTWSFLGNGIQWDFLGQTAASGCEGFPTFRQLIPSTSSGRARGFVALKQKVSILPNHQHALKIRTELLPEKYEKLDILTRLSAKENFIEFCPRENFKTYITTRFDEGREGDTKKNTDSCH